MKWFLISRALVPVLLLAVLVVLAPLSLAHAATVVPTEVTNGDFEQPAVTSWALFSKGDSGLTGWTIEANQVEIVNKSFNGFPVHSGNQALDLLGGSISQNVVGTSPDQTYQLTFYLSGCASGPQTKTLQVSGGGLSSGISKTISFTPVPNQGCNQSFQQVQFPIGSGGSNLWIRFVSTTGLNVTGTGLGPIIDDVSVTPVSQQQPSVLGTWNSDYGPVTFQGSDQQLTGYWVQAPDKRGQITSGSFDPATRKLKFYYYQNWNNQHGVADLTLSPDDHQLQGGWTQENGSGTWTMTRG